MHAAMSASSEDTVALLGRVPVFSALSPDELERVAQVAVPRRFEAGEIVFKEGDEGSTCYIVRSGRARAIRQHPDGRSITLAHFAPGDIFGEMAMFDGRAALGDGRDDRGDGGDRDPRARDMHRLLREHPDISVKLIAALGQRLRDTNERLARQSFQTVQSRVAAVLAQLVEAARAEAGEGSEGDVTITTTQAELAQLAGSSRESASRFLAVLERAGIITQGRGRLDRS